MRGMARYTFELDYEIESCFDCPCQAEDHDKCILSAFQVPGSYGMILKDDGSFPEECPLATIEEYEIGQWAQGVNGQPTRDERLETLRVELYESEVEALHDLARRHRLSTAQTMAMLITESATPDELDRLYSDFNDSPSSTVATVDGVEYHSDWGYGIECIEYFLDALRRRKGLCMRTPHD